MKTQVLRVLVAVLLLGSVGAAQSLTELMQKAIYTQDTLGDVPAAIRIYQQIIAGAPPASALSAQAKRRLAAAQERLLQQAEALRRAAAAQERFGTLDGQTYRHTRTGLTFEVPDGWKVDGTGPSSDNGEMVIMSAVEPTAYVAVWMIPEENDWESIGKKLDASPAEKSRNRQELGFRAWEIQEANRTVIRGQQAMVATARYIDPSGAMAEYMTWIYTQKTHTFFFTRVRADELERLKPQFDRLVYSATIP